MTRNLGSGRLTGDAALGAMSIVRDVAAHSYRKATVGSTRDARRAGM
jgi:hypothetical protein